MATAGDRLAHALALQSRCCGDDAWRGRLCAAHQAWADGYDEAIDHIRQLINHPTEDPTP